MNEIFKSNFFRVGFWFAFLTFILFNFFLYVSENGVHDCHVFHIVGFPFRFYQWGKFAAMEKTLWLGIIGNLIFGVLASFLCGLFRHWIMNKIRLK